MAEAAAALKRSQQRQELHTSTEMAGLIKPAIFMKQRRIVCKYLLCGIIVKLDTPQLADSRSTSLLLYCQHCRTLGSGCVCPTDRPLTSDNLQTKACRVY